ncbi:hypothetical protein PG996_003930 [Apiospora saccharicola]|uniref:Up-regulated during septation protein 1 domain-containing protein n=1 Tax=Apiospora saccharicola TaxID=335842 RepID=A0ABR1W2Q4_9PEZI
MNGLFNRGPAANGFDGGIRPLQPLRTNSGPKPNIPVDHYRQEDPKGDMRSKPRYNPMNPERSSVLVDLKDPVQVHLLTETAILDSKEYEILSQEEVDDLKKQCQLLKQRVEQTRASLAIQSKYRDAAISMARLYSPNNPTRNLLGKRASTGDAAREAEAERQAIQKKCEDLASELSQLEKRATESQRRLLEHTAGILQMTHKAANKGVLTPKMPSMNGIPASPESMFTGSNGRNSLEPPDDLLFDEASLYQSIEDMANFGPMIPRDNNRKKDTIEIPLKSPVRQQTKELTEESERLRIENIQLKQEADSLRSQLQDVQGGDPNQMKLITDTETKLEMFNQQLRELVRTVDPAKNNGYKAPPSGQLEPGDMIGSHLNYLDGALAEVKSSIGNNPEAAESIQAANQQIQELLLSHGSAGYPSPPQMGADLNDQFDYLQDAIRVAGQSMDRAAALAAASSDVKQKGDQSEAVLMGLWDIIQAGLADAEQRKRDRRKTRMDKGINAEEEDMSDNEGFDPNETYSLQAFSAKVQWLFAQAASLKDKKGVLERQIKQQRELNSKSDVEKEEAMKAKDEEIDQARSQLAQVEREADGIRQQLSDALTELDTAHNSQKQGNAEQDAAIKEATEKLKERNAKIASLEADSRDIQMRLTTAETNIAIITRQLQDANQAKDEADKAVTEKEADVTAKTDELKSKQNEIDELMGMVAEFKMRATMAEAELDGAYGSRRERALEAAALYDKDGTKQLQDKVATLTPRVAELETELRGTVKDLKDITKQAIDAEAKIADLEAELDRTAQQARREKEELQESLDREKLSRGALSPGMPLSPGGSRSSSIVTDSYREALRAERKKHDEQLRAEQANRRKLEEELRALKRAQGPGKSPLSPRV